jgi:hypothetical protein
MVPTVDLTPSCPIRNEFTDALGSHASPVACLVGRLGLRAKAAEWRCSSPDHFAANLGELYSNLRLKALDVHDSTSDRLAPSGGSTASSGAGKVGFPGLHNSTESAFCS